MSGDVLARLRAASNNEALGIGQAWALLDEAAEEVAALRSLLAECRPIVARADAVFLPPKGTCTWGPEERDALLARIDALVQP
jgi:hypothetical protein